MKHIFLILAICASATLFGAAHNTADLQALHEIIKVDRAVDSHMEYQLEFDRRSKSKVIACLMADERLEKGAAAQALADLRSVHLKAGLGRIPQNQFAKITQAIQPTAKWTAIFVLDSYWDIWRRPLLYMRILNKTVVHTGHVERSLYCKLSNTEQPIVKYEESNIAQAVWDETGGLQQDEIGFEIDAQAFNRIVNQETCCSIL